MPLRSHRVAGRGRSAAGPRLDRAYLVIVAVLGSSLAAKEGQDKPGDLGDKEDEPRDRLVKEDQGNPSDCQKCGQTTRDQKTRELVARELFEVSLVDAKRLFLHLALMLSLVGVVANDRLRHARLNSLQRLEPSVVREGAAVGLPRGYELCLALLPSASTTPSTSSAAGTSRSCPWGSSVKAAQGAEGGDAGCFELLLERGLRTDADTRLPSASRNADADIRANEDQPAPRTLPEFRARELASLSIERRAGLDPSQRLAYLHPNVAGLAVQLKMNLDSTAPDHRG